MATNQPQLTDAQVKEAQARLRSFEVGIGQACNDMGIDYDVLAKAAGVESDQLGPALVEKLVEAAAAAEAQHTK